MRIPLSALPLPLFILLREAIATSPADAVTTPILPSPPKTCLVAQGDPFGYLGDQCPAGQPINDAEGISGSILGLLYPGKDPERQRVEGVAVDVASASSSTEQESLAAKEEETGFLSFEEWKEKQLKELEESLKLKSEAEKEKDLNERIETAIKIQEQGGGIEGEQSAEAVKAGVVASENEKEVEKKAAGAASGKQGTGPHPSGNRPAAQSHRYNYASPDCSARIHSASKASQNPSSVLHKSKDRYMLTPCSSKEHWVVIELCDDIRIEGIEIGMFEFFSGVVREVNVSVGGAEDDDVQEDEDGNIIDVRREWEQVGHFIGKNVRGSQSFTLSQPTSFQRFIRLDFPTYYGSEYYCPISSVKVYGMNQMEAYKWQDRRRRAEEDEARRRQVASDKVASAAPPSSASAQSSTMEQTATTTSTTSATADRSISIPEQASASVDASPSPSSSLPVDTPSTTPTTSDKAMSAESSSERPTASSSLVSSSSSTTSESQATQTSTLASPSDSPSSMTSPSQPAASASATSSDSQTIAAGVGSNATQFFENRGNATEKVSEAHVPPVASPVVSANGTTTVEPATSPITSSSSSSGVSSSAASSSSQVAPPLSASSSSTTTSQVTVHTAAFRQPPPSRADSSESIYAYIIRRLDALEGNSSLATLYVEEQTRSTQAMLARLEKALNGWQATAASDLNRTLEAERSRADKRLTQALTRIQQKEVLLEREKLALKAQLRALSDEISYEKRRGVAQLIFTLALVIIGALSQARHLERVFMPLATPARSKKLSISLPKLDIPPRQEGAHLQPPMDQEQRAYQRYSPSPRYRKPSTPTGTKTWPRLQAANLSRTHSEAAHAADRVRMRFPSGAPINPQRKLARSAHLHFLDAEKQRTPGRAVDASLTPKRMSSPGLPFNDGVFATEKTPVAKSASRWASVEDAPDEDIGSASEVESDFRTEDGMSVVGGDEDR